MTPDEVTKLEELASKATEGVWAIHEATFGHEVFVVTDANDEEATIVDLCHCIRQEDAEFLLQSRTAVPQLCAALRSAWAVVEAARDVSDAYGFAAPEKNMIAAIDTLDAALAAHDEASR